MSHIGEALRRARSSVLEEAPPPALSLVADPPAFLEPPDPPAPDCSFDPVDVLRAAPPEVEALAAPAADPASDILREPGAPALPRASFDEKLILNADVPVGVVEQYRRVAASLHQLQLDRGVKLVMIASAMANDGKTLTASNLALTLSESFRRRVLLVDADLRRPSVHALFGTPNVTGLNDALEADCEQKLTVFDVTPRLSVLPSGRPNPDPMSNLSSGRMRKILVEASAKFDWVVVDTPPVGLLADAKLLAEMVDVVILVIGAGSTPFRAVQRAVEVIDRKRIAGVVLNRALEHPGAYQYGGYYGGGARG